MVLNFDVCKEQNNSQGDYDDRYLAYCAEELYHFILEDIDEQKKMYEKIVEEKDAEINFLKKLISSKDKQIKKLAEQVHILTLLKV